MSAKENLVAVTAPPPKKAPAKRKKPTAPAQPSRKSRRKQGAAPEYAPSASVGGDDVLFADADGEDEEAAAAREAAAAAVQAERERRYERLFLRHAEEGLELPETASYGHTVMRVDTMSEAALSNRVRVIERAAGSYAVIKMKQFAEVSVRRSTCVLPRCMWWRLRPHVRPARYSSWKGTKKCPRRLTRHFRDCWSCRNSRVRTGHRCWSSARRRRRSRMRSLQDSSSSGRPHRMWRVCVNIVHWGTRDNRPNARKTIMAEEAAWPRSPRTKRSPLPGERGKFDATRS
jgi:hypothetical protein